MRLSQLDRRAGETFRSYRAPFDRHYYLRILFVTAAGEVLIYDAQGKRVRAMTLPEGTEITPQAGGANSPASGGGNNKQSAGFRDEKDAEDDDSDDETKGGEGKEAGEKSSSGRGGKKGRVIFVDWYDGAEGLLHPQVPTLCIALDGGFVQLSRGVDDGTPLVVNAHMTIRQASKIYRGLGQLCAREMALKSHSLQCGGTISWPFEILPFRPRFRERADATPPS